MLVVLLGKVLGLFGNLLVTQEENLCLQFNECYLDWFKIDK